MQVIDIKISLSSGNKVSAYKAAVLVNAVTNYPILFCGWDKTPSMEDLEELVKEKDRIKKILN
jgi:hypothetical protein